MVSIIVPVYNVINELGRCVGSLTAQTHTDIEIILVDDGSTDGSGDLCEILTQSDSRILAVHKVNGGLSSARNAGLDAARGDWILFVDSDDYIDLNTCERFVRIGETTNADIIVGEAIQESESYKNEMLRHGLVEGKVYSAKAFVSIAIKHREYYAPVCFNCYKKAFLDRKRLRFTEGLLHEDMEIQPRLFLGANRISYLSQPFYHYIARQGSIMKSSNQDKRIEAMTSIYTAWKETFDSVSDFQLQKLLYGHLAKCYLKSYRDLCEHGGLLPVDGIDFRFLYRYGLDGKEKLKSVIFCAEGLIGNRRGN